MARYRPGDKYDRSDLCNKTWEELYGTDLEGNLAQHLKNHQGNCWRPCPYSTQAVAIFGAEWDNYESLYGEIDRHLYIKSMLNVTTIPTLVDHTLSNGKVVYLKYAYRGAWGFECTFPGCTYFVENNKRYFYI